MRDVKWQMTKVLILQKPLGAIRVQFVVQSLEADAEQLSGARLVVTSFVERPENHLALDFFERRPHGKAYRVFGAQSLTLIERIR